ncbi:MAG: C40 family peptidase [Lachnospiraceae bacterium]|nr:C40 family peptidase [Lachnospiraceae bacterium]
MERYIYAASKMLVPLYGAPNERTPVEDEILCGMQAEVLGVRPGWHYVRTEYGFEGFVRSGDLVKSASDWRRAPRRQVCAPFADVLRRPGVKGGLLGTLSRGARPGLAGEEEDGWQPVVLPDGKRGYMQASRLAEIPDGVSWPEEKLRASVVTTALSYLGTSYRWGGKTPLGIDCSGLTFMSYWCHGIGIYRNAQIRDGFLVHPIPLEQAKPGDLLYFPGHVAMLVEGLMYVHATGRAGSDGVVFNSLDENSERFRLDLKEKLLTAGTIF